MNPEDVPDDLAELDALILSEQLREGSAFAATVCCPYGCRVGVMRAGWTVGDGGRGGWQAQHERGCPTRLEGDGES